MLRRASFPTPLSLRGVFPERRALLDILHFAEETG